MRYDIPEQYANSYSISFFLFLFHIFFISIIMNIDLLNQLANAWATTT